MSCKRSILASMVALAWAPSVPAETPVKVGIGRIRPLTYMDDRGNPAGFVVDVVIEAARRERIPITWVKFTSSAASEDDLAAGRIDVLPAGMVTAERQQRFYVSEPWWSSELALVSREAEFRISSLAISPLYRELAQPAYPSAVLIPQTSLDHRIRDVCAGKTDAALLTHGELHDVFLYRDYLKDCDGVRLQSGDTQITIDLSVITRKTDVALARRLRKRIDEMALDGTLFHFAQKNPPASLSEVVKLEKRLRQRSRTISLAVSGGTVFCFLLWYLLEKRRDYKRVEDHQTRMTLIHEVARIGTFTWHIPEKRVVWSSELYKLYGYGPESIEATIENWRDKILHPDDAGRAMSEIESAMAIRLPVLESHFRIVKPDGAVRWLHGRSLFTYGSDGVPQSMMGVNIDLTDQTLAEEGLRQSNAQLEAILDSIPEPVMVTDAAGNLRRTNTAFDNDILYKTTVDGYVGHVEAYEEDGRLIPPAQWPINRVRRGERVDKWDLMLSIDGERSNRRFSGSPVRDEDGKVTHAVVTFFDITDQKRTAEALREMNDELHRAECRLRLKHEVARLGTFEWFLGEDRVVWSPEMEALYGIESETHEHTLKEWKTFVHLEDLPLVSELMELALQNQQPTLDTTYRIVRRDGSLAWIHSRGKYEYDADGQPVHMMGVNMDITELKHFEEWLKAAYEELRAVFEISPTAMYVVNADQEIVDRNRAYMEAFSEFPDVSRSVDDRPFLIRPQFRMETVNGEPILRDLYPIVRALRGETFTDERCRITDIRTGTSKECTVSGRPITDAQGHICKAVIGIHDITQLVEAEAAVKSAYKELSVFLDVIPTGVIVIDADNNVVHRNRAHRKKFPDIPATRYATLNSYELNTLTGDIVEKNNYPTQRTLRGEKVVEELFAVTYASTGERLICSISGVPVYDALGNVIQAVMSVHDVTDLKNAEGMAQAALDELNAIFEVSPTAVAVIDQENRIVRSNRAHRAMFGPRPDLGGCETTTDLYKIRTLDRQYCDAQNYPARRVFRGGTVSNEVLLFEDVITRRTTVCLVSGLPIHDTNGGVRHVVVALQDVTKMVKTEEELRRSNDELQAFAYTVSHDLAEPIRQVSAFTELLVRRSTGNLDDESKKLFEYIRDGVTRINSMIEGLLQYSRVGASDKPKESIDCNEVIRNVLRNLELKIAENNAVVHVAQMPTVWAWPGRIDQVFQNLIQNAIKYRKRDVAPEIHIKVREHPHEWLFAVQDNGIGFDQKDAHKIFALFRQLHRRGQYEGMGMGLAIVKRIVERHSGQVCAESTLGIGSAFYFTIPKNSLGLNDGSAEAA